MRDFESNAEGGSLACVGRGGVENLGGVFSFSLTFVAVVALESFLYSLYLSANEG